VYEAAAFTTYHVLLGVPRDVAAGMAVVGHAAYLVPFVGLGWAVLSVGQVRALVVRRRGGRRERRASAPPG
jgi:hypothetical protein